MTKISQTLPEQELPKDLGREKISDRNHFPSQILGLFNPPPLFVEIGPALLIAVRESQSVELPLERQPDGRLTASCKETLVAMLNKFVNAKPWQPRAKAFCAVGARGVSLRRLSLPGGTREELEQRLLLQIEAEFPLSPDELAWGWQALGDARSNGAPGKRDLLVAAVKKEIVADYREVLRACGTEPVFTLAALARAELCGAQTGSFVLVDVGGGQAELAFFENGVPVAARTVFWDATAEANATNAVAPALSGSGKIFLTGEPISETHFTGRCERLSVSGSAAIAGLQKLAANGGPPLVLRLERAGGAASSLATLDWKKWGVRAGVLAAVALLLPFGEAILLKSHLEKKVAAFKTESARLKVIDREKEFLGELKQSQPPYLETLSVLAKSVPPGTHFDSLSLNSHGEVSLRCAFRDGQQVAEFRTKLIASGFFTNAVVEDQTPTPDRQRVNVRMTAQQKPLPQLQALAMSLPAEETNKESKVTAPGGLPVGALPPGVSPLVVPPSAKKEPPK